MTEPSAVKATTTVRVPGSPAPTAATEGPPSTTLEDCCQLCNTTTGCNAFTWLAAVSDEQPVAVGKASGACFLVNKTMFSAAKTDASLNKDVVGGFI